jgi:uncharacterized membrane protein YphA (DoxX/SURF4 family)
MVKTYENADLGLLSVRLALGAVFVAHGVAKLQNMSGTVAFFASLGFPAPLAYLVAAVETLGGLAMLAGVATPVAGVLLAAVMVVAILKVKLARGFLGGYEFELTLLLAALGVALAGPGRYALQRGRQSAPPAPSVQ